MKYALILFMVLITTFIANSQHGWPIRVCRELRIGDRYKDGLVIAINHQRKAITISSTRPIGSGGWNHAESICRNYTLNGYSWRMPSRNELLTIFSLKQYLDGYENNWYWTNQYRGNSALHIGIGLRDEAYVPKEHGKLVFAVTDIYEN